MSEEFSYAHLPMRFSALVIETTSRCNAKCAMCYQSSGPKGHDQFGINELKLDVLKRVVTDAMKVPNLNKRLHVAGGEAFLDEKLVFALLAHGRDAGFTDITMTTNAFWGSSEERADTICRKLVDAGMTEIEISWDYWHLQYIDPKRVVRVLEACRRNGISTILRVLTTSLHSADEALDLLGEGWIAADRIMWGKVFGTGRAATHLEPGELFPESLTADENCHNFLNLVVNATGEVFPCCAGIDQTENPKLGNVYREPVHEVAARMTRNLWLRKLTFDGVMAVEDLLDEAGYDYQRDENAGMCTRCWKLFSDPKATQVVKEQGVELGRKIVAQVMAQVG